MFRRKWILGPVAAALLLGAMVNGCTKAEDPWAKVEGGPLKVLVSFPPLYCFTKAVGDKDCAVLSLLGPTGPHDHRATADDAHVAQGADLFLVNGLQLDDFVDNIVTNSGNKKVKVVKVADEALVASAPPRIRLGAHKHVHADGTECNHGEWDPHAWLGISQAVLMVQHICKTLKQADPAHAADFDKRAAAYVEKLRQLQADGKKLLAGKTNRKIISTHDALGYFCRGYDLELVDSIMPRPGIEASGVEMAKLVDICKEKQVRIIAIEPQYKRDAAETLRGALKKEGIEVVIVEVDPMETAPRDQLNPDYYFAVMRKNLDNLAKAMQ